MKNKVELYFDGKLVECEQRDDRNDEFLFVATDGSERFIKFAADVDLDETIKRYNKLNSKEVEIIKDAVYGDVITHGKNGEVVNVTKS